MSKNYKRKNHHLFQVSTQSEYTKSLKNYLNYQYPKVKPILFKIASSKQASQLASKYPLFKLINAMVKKLMLNHFECIFLAYIVSANRWHINDEIIKKYSKQIKDLIFISDLKDEWEYKSLLLYLLLSSYSVKYYLNDVLKDIQIQVNNLCSKFNLIFREWANYQANYTLKINPRSLNRTFIEMNSTYTNKEDQTIEGNYNILVDNLLQISPSYNTQPQKCKKKRKIVREQLKKEEVDIQDFGNQKQKKQQEKKNKGLMINGKFQSSEQKIPNLYLTSITIASSNKKIECSKSINLNISTNFDNKNERGEVMELRVFDNINNGFSDTQPYVKADEEQDIKKAQQTDKYIKN